MSVAYIGLGLAYIALCVAIVVMILMQKKGSGLGAGMSGMGGESTYWSKNKGRSLEGALEKYSKIGGAVFMVLSLVLCLIK